LFNNNITTSSPIEHTIANASRPYECTNKSILLGGINSLSRCGPEENTLPDSITIRIKKKKEKREGYMSHMCDRSGLIPTNTEIARASLHHPAFLIPLATLSYFVPYSILTVRVLRQPSDLRLRAAMVLRVARQSARQRRRDDVEEADSLHDDIGASRVFRAEYTARADGLRGQERRQDLVVGYRM